MTWKYAFGSATGTSHLGANIPCQDFGLCDVLTTPAQETILVAVTADGAGSAKRSQVGAQLACNLFQAEMAVLFLEGGHLAQITRSFIVEWLTRFQSEVAVRAADEGLLVRDFACTLLAVVLTEDAGVFVQVGDGAIVISCQDDADEFAWIFWPDKGEYANMTTFATQEEAKEQFLYDFKQEAFQEIALFTDGLERLALNFQSGSTHNPFFRAMFAPVRASEPGYSQELSERLQAFLNSPQVNARTDDDKTLILATRRIIEQTTEISANDA